MYKIFTYFIYLIIITLFLIEHILQNFIYIYKFFFIFYNLSQKFLKYFI